MTHSPGRVPATPQRQTSNTQARAQHRSAQPTPPDSYTRSYNTPLTTTDHSTRNTWIPDTWQTGSRIGEIESLSVLPHMRGSGLGSELLTRLEDHLLALGVNDVILGALPGNSDAIRLYERRGYQATWLYLSRFQGR